MSEFPIIPGYSIERELGQGGMARVYLAFEEKLEREVALKVLLPGLTDDKRLIERFLKEAKISARLNHPNIIHIYDVGNVNGNIYMAMEYIEGSSLKEKIQNEELYKDEIFKIIISIADALEYSHNRGVIHRDIKPDNILFHPNGRPVVVDFGIAKAVDSNTKLTKTGMSIGTPHYMSPEQGRGIVLDNRSDIYSLGVVLYEMITSKQPYDAENTVGVVIKHIQEPIPRLADSFQPSAISQFKNEELEKLQALINKMMAKNKEDRPQSGKEVIELIGKPSAISHQLSADKNKIETPENLIGLNSNLPSPDVGTQRIAPGYDLPNDDVGVQNNEPHSEKPKKFTKKKKHPSVELLVTTLIILFVILAWYLINSSNKRADVAPYTLSNTRSGVNLRSSYCTLSTDEVKSMLKKHDFFDSSWNKGGNFHNDFRLRTINGDKAVADKSTGLMWHQGGSSSYMNFSKAEEWIRALNSRGHAGHYDWRLPTLEEAASILESSKSGKLYIDPVFSQKQWWIWTGDKYDSSRGWVVYFIYGFIDWNFFTSFFYVRPVRMDN